MKELTLTMTSKQDAILQYPDFPWLSLGDVDQIDSVLRQRQWLATDEKIRRCEKAGEGNMNLTMRVITDQRSLIVKQSRPWVEKYDHIAAPWDRSEFECRFYERIQGIPSVAARMPKLLHVDTAARMFVLEDLGDTQTLASLYSGDRLADTDVRQLADYIAKLHQSTRGAPDPEFLNIEMRKLNHQHIFEIPLAADNGIDLEPIESGLSDAALRLRNDQAYREAVDMVGNRYLSKVPVRNDPALVHGDYFPGSWLRSHSGIYVIDPEFCFFGDPEFDVGCAVAHLRLSQQPIEQAERFVQAYTEGQQGADFEPSLVSGYAAAEVMRRLIGVAQLPLQTSNGQRAEMLEQSRGAMIGRTWEELWS